MWGSLLRDQWDINCGFLFWGNQLKVVQGVHCRSVGNEGSFKGLLRRVFCGVCFGDFLRAKIHHKHFSVLFAVDSIEQSINIGINSSSYEVSKQVHPISSGIISFDGEKSVIQYLKSIAKYKHSHNHHDHLSDSFVLCFSACSVWGKIKPNQLISCCSYLQ